jgi:hypothetical protein
MLSLQFTDEQSGSQDPNPRQPGSGVHIPPPFWCRQEVPAAHEGHKWSVASGGKGPVAVLPVASAAGQEVAKATLCVSGLQNQAWSKEGALPVSAEDDAGVGLIRTAPLCPKRWEAAVCRRPSPGQVSSEEVT